MSLDFIQLGTKYKRELRYSREDKYHHAACSAFAGSLNVSTNRHTILRADCVFCSGGWGLFTWMGQQARRASAYTLIMLLSILLYYALTPSIEICYIYSTISIRKANTLKPQLLMALTTAGTGSLVWALDWQLVLGCCLLRPYYTHLLVSNGGRIKSKLSVELVCVLFPKKCVLYFVVMSC